LRKLESDCQKNSQFVSFYEEKQLNPDTFEEKIDKKSQKGEEK